MARRAISIRRDQNRNLAEEFLIQRRGSYNCGYYSDSDNDEVRTRTAEVFYPTSWTQLATTPLVVEENIISRPLSNMELQALSEEQLRKTNCKFSSPQTSENMIGQQYLSNEDDKQNINKPSFVRNKQSKNKEIMPHDDFLTYDLSDDKNDAEETAEDEELEKENAENETINESTDQNKDETFIRKEGDKLPKKASTVSSVVMSSSAIGTPLAPVFERTEIPPVMVRHSSILDLGHKVKDLSKTVKMAAEDELRHEAQNFAGSTTAHGIPLAIKAKKWYGRCLWSTLSIVSVGLFIYQCILVFNKFQRKDKIVSVRLQFENAAFPAVTICSLNPFKKHLARSVPEISETLEAYHQAVTYSKDAHQQYGPSRERRSAQNPGGFRYVQFEPVMSDCECEKPFPGKKRTRNDCIQKDTIPSNNISLCICNYDRQDATVWPCYQKTSWVESVCPECNDIGYCNLPNTNGTNELPCICQKDVNYCLLRPERLKRMWEIRGNQIPNEDSPFRADFLAQLKELGFENMTDEVAITTKTKERLVLTMAALPVHRRIALSYGKSEFIRMCSFNGQQCDIINDFKLHVDPAFGNCYTFNANRDLPLQSSRAGPSNGLRLLMHINTSDYLPTTQASGVRIAIHSQDEWPFPDSFGYSAPTDSVSSFGISLRKVNRLPMPYGDCASSDEKPPDNYIYRNYKYEPEGCYRSCYQNHIIRKCGCADPRYPVPFNRTKVCDSFDPLSRNCLLIEGIKFTRHHFCKCKHPCQHDVYTTTFSSAKLTPSAFRGSGCAGRGCQFDLDSAAMVEIYYERTSYEVLSESESYMFVNFMSDVGGQAGLWLGASVITVFEFAVFLLRVLTIFCRRRTRKAVSGSFAGDNFFSFSEINNYSGKRRTSSACLDIISNSMSDPKLCTGLDLETRRRLAECAAATARQRNQSAPNMKLIYNQMGSSHVDTPSALTRRERNDSTHDTYHFKHGVLSHLQDQISQAINK